MVRSTIGRVNGVIECGANFAGSRHFPTRVAVRIGFSSRHDDVPRIHEVVTRLSYSRRTQKLLCAQSRIFETDRTFTSVLDLSVHTLVAARKSRSPSSVPLRGRGMDLAVNSIYLAWGRGMKSCGKGGAALTRRSQGFVVRAVSVKAGRPRGRNLFEI